MHIVVYIYICIVHYLRATYRVNGMLHVKFIVFRILIFIIK